MYCYCIKKRTIIEILICNDCLDKEYKKRQKIKPVSKKTTIATRIKHIKTKSIGTMFY